MPKRDMIGVAPTIHPWHSRRVAKGIGAFFFFFRHGDSRCLLLDMRHLHVMGGVCSEGETAGRATKDFQGRGYRDTAAIRQMACQASR
jgi:hypothetical protein